MSTVEDPMELSLDLDRRQMAHEDIDIDLDLSGDQPLEREDDYMAEDANPAIDQGTFDAQEVQGARDDEMFDDECSLHEAEDNSSEHDEDLDDATYPAQDENFGLGSDTLTVHDLEDGDELSDSASGRQDAGVATLLDQPQTATGSSPSNNKEAIVSERPIEIVSDPANAKQGHENLEAQEHLQHLDCTSNDLSQVVREVFTEDETTVQEHDSSWNATTSKKPEEYPAHPSDPEGREITSDEPTFNMHPVTVVYQGSEMSLFPPADEDQDQDHPQTYFLHDESLAGESITNLFCACRVVLAESIEEEAEELEITIGELGLQISESATECSTTTLTQILDLYVHLQRCDGDDSPGPLYIVLSTKFKFSHRLNYLLSAAAEGKGLLHLMPSEGVEEEDQNSDSHFEQEEDAQGKYPQIPKRNYNAEVGRDFLHEAPTHEDANDEHPMFHQQLENLTPELKEYEVEGPADLPLSANQASEPEKIQTVISSSDARDDAQQTEAPIDETTQQEFNALPTVDEKQNAVEDPDLIYYEDEHDLNHDSSAESSTIQGDIHEATVDSYNRYVEESTAATKMDDTISIQKTLDGDSAAWGNDQPYIPTQISDASGDDAINFAIDAEVEELQNTSTTDDQDFKVESVSVHHQERSFLVDRDEHEEGSGGAQNSMSVEEHDPRFIVDASHDEDAASLYSEVDSISSINIPQTNSKEFGDQHGSGHTPSKTEFDEFATTEQSHTRRNANESASGNTAGTSAGDDITAHNIEGPEFYQSDEFAVRDRPDRNILESTYQTLPSTRAPQDLLADSDEITYEGDGNEPEPLKVYSSEKKSNSGLVPSKRMRSDHEGLDVVENSRQADPKRLRSG